MFDGVDLYTLLVGTDTAEDSDLLPATTHVDIITVNGLRFAGADEGIRIYGGPQLLHEGMVQKPDTDATAVEEVRAAEATALLSGRFWERWNRADTSRRSIAFVAKVLGWRPIGVGVIHEIRGLACR